MPAPGKFFMRGPLGQCIKFAIAPDKIIDATILATELVPPSDGNDFCMLRYLIRSAETGKNMMTPAVPIIDEKVAVPL